MPSIIPSALARAEFSVFLPPLTADERRASKVSSESTQSDKELYRIAIERQRLLDLLREGNVTITGPESARLWFVLALLSKRLLQLIASTCVRVCSPQMRCWC